MFHKKDETVQERETVGVNCRHNLHDTSVSVCVYMCAYWNNTIGKKCGQLTHFTYEFNAGKHWKRKQPKWSSRTDY